MLPPPWLKPSVGIYCCDIGSRKGKVVNDKGNLRWRFPVNSEVGRIAVVYTHRWMLSIYFLLTNHDIKNHVVSMLHAHRADLAEVLNRLLDILLYDAVMLRNAHALSCKHCRLKRT